MKYYEFWLKSSRQTDEMTIRLYRETHTKEQLKEDLEAWCACFGAWTASENVCSYGSRLIPASQLPKNREDALARHTKAYGLFAKAKAKQRFAAKILAVAPFSGEKI